MSDRYMPTDFEAKWRAKWAAADLFVTREDEDRPKFYGLDFFPYPSGAGLSVGHCRNYVPTDVLCRAKFMQGFNVLHPMGFDAFGLPAENEAIKNQTHPGPMIDQYAANYKRQMDLVGISYDWSRSFKSSDPSYYRWTQWIFKLLFDRGLAYRKLATVNWCPKDKTALANEEVVAGCCERCGTPVEKRDIPQWFFKITEYAQRLIDDLDTVDWPEGIKQQQRNWIGRSEGVEFDMPVHFGSENSEPEAPNAALGASSPPEDPRLPLTDVQMLEAEVRAEIEASGEKPETDPHVAIRMQHAGSKLDIAASSVMHGGRLTEAIQQVDDMGVKIEVRSGHRRPHFRVFTTRIDTIFGVTFCVLAPEHPLVATLVAVAEPKLREELQAYVSKAAALSDTDRQAINREKTGVFTGAYATNPANGERVPIWIADYVLMGYGTGAIMAVPGHDERDFEFAQAHQIPIRQVISETEEADPSIPLPYAAKDGYMVNSGEYSGLTVSAGQQKLGEWMEALGIGERKVHYRLRDWLISRQRYWGCPIPVIHSKEGELELVPDQDLPVELPPVESYEPTDDGSSPLSRIDQFVNVTDRDGRLGHRETDTMGGFACSSWYFLRFCDPHNDKAAWNLERVKHWMPVDCYVGGAEHAVMHLLYARFWTKVLFDAGLSPVKEPFQRLLNQGQVLNYTPYRKPKPGEQLAIGEEGILITADEAAALPKDEVLWRWVRMSKSKGNVVTPDEMVEEYGADALRVYELFVAPFDADVQWSSSGVQGSVRFLHRVFKAVSEARPYYDPSWRGKLAGAALDGEEHASARDLRRVCHRTIQKATEDIEKFGFNTYVSALMVFVNALGDFQRARPKPSDAEQIVLSEAVESLILLLAPAAPHSADEMWEMLGNSGFTYQAAWPKADPELAKSETVTIAVQVNGKLRDTIEMPTGASNDQVQAEAMTSGKVQQHLQGLTIRKVIVIQDRLINVVAT